MTDDRDHSVAFLQDRLRDLVRRDLVSEENGPVVPKPVLVPASTTSRVASSRTLTRLAHRARRAGETRRNRSKRL